MDYDVDKLDESSRRIMPVYHVYAIAICLNDNSYVITVNLHELTGMLANGSLLAGILNQLQY